MRCLVFGDVDVRDTEMLGLAMALTVTMAVTADGPSPRNVHVVALGSAHFPDRKRT